MSTIHERGYWLGDKIVFKPDFGLCKAIIRLARLWDVETVVDIGCGGGGYVRALTDAGFICRGYDGNPNTDEIFNCEVQDFSELVNIGTFDLVLCLEVGEHVPKEYESNVLDNITIAANKHVVLSWAIEGQGGDGHVNCRNNDYIINQMRQRGFVYDKSESILLKRKSVKKWFRDTVMIFHHE